VPHEVRAATTANVLQVEVAEGDTVNAGDTIAILESMKMEIPVVTEESGTIRTIAVAAGATVSDGDLIAVVVPA
jgi:acetyl-CoA carboxylase biotin carboxyl carrier protein